MTPPQLSKKAPPVESNPRSIHEYEDLRRLPLFEPPGTKSGVSEILRPQFKKMIEDLQKRGVFSAPGCGGGASRFFAEKAPIKPIDQYGQILRDAKERAQLRLNGGGVDTKVIEELILQMEKLSPKAGKKPAELEKDKKEIFGEVYKTLVEEAKGFGRKGIENSDFAVLIPQIEKYGRLAGKTKADIEGDMRTVYREFFDVTYGKAFDCATKREDGTDFSKHLSEMDRYGAQAGISQSDIASMKKSLFQTLYEEILKEEKGKLLLNCDNPDKDIVFDSRGLQIKGYNCNHILDYGRLAGKTTAEMVKDIEDLKNDIKTENQKRIKNDLLEGAKKLVEVPQKALERIVEVPIKAAEEAGKGLQRMADGIGKFVKGLG